MRRAGFLLLVCWGAAWGQTRPSEAEIGSIQVYMTAAEAQTKIFPRGISSKLEIKPIPAALKAKIEEKLGRRFADDTLKVGLVYGAKEAFLGYAIVTEEIGKYRPITFMVGIDPDFSVRGAAVLVYRESRGGQVRRARFLRQYRGKSLADPIRINRDIVNITGATMSVRSLNFGVKKLLCLTEALYSQSVYKAPQ